MAKSSKSRTYCFTVNYPDEKGYTVDLLLDHLSKKHKASYCIIGEEVGKTGNPHYQGFVHFPTQRSFKAVAKYIPGWHVENCKGTIEENIVYCSKDGKWQEIGERPVQGARTDLREIKNKIMSGSSLYDVIASDDVVNYQQLKFAEGIAKYQRTQGKWFPKSVYWFHGPAGVGKTRTCVDMCPDGDYWISNGDLKWFDGYNGQSHVIFDDIRADSCKFNYLLRLLDGYPMKVEIKGGYVDWTPRVIYITCAFSPHELFGDIGESILQLTRRLEDVTLLKDKRDSEVGGNTTPRPQIIKF